MSKISNNFKLIKLDVSHPIFKDKLNHLTTKNKSLIRKYWNFLNGDICPICLKRMLYEKEHSQSFRYASIDHILARKFMPDPTFSNVWILCIKCNGLKSILEYGKIKGNYRRSMQFTDLMLKIKFNMSTLNQTEFENYFNSQVESIRELVHE